jgi:hypothetical protein
MNHEFLLYISSIHILNNIQIRKEVSNNMCDNIKLFKILKMIAYVNLYLHTYGAEPFLKSH